MPQDPHPAGPLAAMEKERELYRQQYLKARANYDNKIKELSLLKELGEVLRSSHFFDRNALLKEQLAIIQRYTHIEGIRFLMTRSVTGRLEVIAREGICEEPAISALVDGDLSAPQLAAHQKQPIFIDAEDPAGLSSEGESRLLYQLHLPVLHNQRAIGVLSLFNRGSDPFDTNQIRFLGLVTDQLATTVILSRLYSQMLKEEQQRFLLSRFFSRSVTDEIINSQGDLKLGGERRSVAILFADLRGFTSIAEKLDQERVVRVLNAFFSCMVPIIFQHRGTLDKFLGDGLMAFFGAPIPHPDAAILAVETALEMIVEIRSFNRQHRNDAWPELRMGIGINTGEVIAGYIGAEDHLSYTVIGDAVNVAQRIESIAAPDTILISRGVLDQIAHDTEGVMKRARALPGPNAALKGKEKPTELFRLEMTAEL